MEIEVPKHLRGVLHEGRSRWENLAAILLGFRERGVKFRISEKTRQFVYMDTNNVLEEWEIVGIDTIRAGLTLALRIGRGELTEEQADAESAKSDYRESESDTLFG